MAHVERPTFTQKIPAHAERKHIDGAEHACWIDRRGRKVAALILPTGRCRRVVMGRWIGIYRTHTGDRAKTKPFTDRSIALEAALKLEKQGRAIREGRAPANLETGNLHLIDHVNDYAGHLEVNGRSEKHVFEVRGILITVIQGAQLGTPGSVDHTRLNAWLERQRRTGRKHTKTNGKPLSLRTRNKWVASLHAFGSWLEEAGRVEVNPFRRLVKANQDMDPRHIRRALDHADFVKLIDHTRQMPPYLKLSGPDRAMLYLTAAYTGFRLTSILCLTRESFEIVDGVATSVMVRAETTKKQKAHTVPLPADVGRQLAEWMKNREPGRLWPWKHSTHGSLTLRRDLEAAGIPYRDSVDRVFDFHALRGQYATMLVRAGVSAGVVQKLMDHSDPKLTARYTRLAQTDLVQAVASLPSLGPPLGSEVGRSGRKVRHSDSKGGKHGTDKKKKNP